MSRWNKPTSVSQRHINQYVKCIGFGQYSVQYHVLQPRLRIILASRRLFTLWANEWPVETHGVMLWATPLPISDTVDQRLAKIHPHWSHIAHLIHTTAKKISNCYMWPLIQSSLEGCQEMPLANGSDFVYNLTLQHNAMRIHAHEYQNSSKTPRRRWSHRNHNQRPRISKLLYKWT